MRGSALPPCPAAVRRPGSRRGGADTNPPERLSAMPGLQYDSHHLFDAGLLFDSGSLPPSPPGPTPRTTLMSIIALKLKDKTIDQKLPLGQNHITSMDGNTLYPNAARKPTDAEFQTAQDELQAAHNDANTKETAWKAALQTRAVKETVWDAVITARARNCESITPGDRAALATTGLPLRSDPSSVGIPDAPIDLLATPDKIEGQLKVRWKRVKGATSYIVERMIHGGPDTWAQIKLLSQSRFTDTDLTSGTIYAYRVRALAAAGPGPWSDETVKMAP